LHEGLEKYVRLRLPFSLLTSGNSLILHKNYPMSASFYPVKIGTFLKVFNRLLKSRSDNRRAYADGRGRRRGSLERHTPPDAMRGREQDSGLMTAAGESARYHPKTSDFVHQPTEPTPERTT
jgi:hypothetical protein